MSETIRYIAPAKINLGLKVLGRRLDAYHDIETVFYRVLEPHDSIAVTESDIFRLTCSDSRLPVDSRNLMIRAANLYTEISGLALPHIHVHLDKRIPMGAGLGGGSSDAATMLQILKTHAPNEVSIDLQRFGSSLGADVPFFLSGSKAALASGIGEILQPMEFELHRSIVIAFDPTIHVSTKDAYQNLNRPLLDSSKNASCSMDDFSKALITGSLQNDFETTVFSHHPTLGRIKDTMYERGAAFALMSGSGSAIFGLFEDIATAGVAKTAFEEEGLLTFLS